jgi:Flp pilus assembly protein TadD
VLNGQATDADYLRELAKILAEQGLLDEAIKVIEKARNLRPNGPGIIQLHESYLEKLEVRSGASMDG